MASMESLVSLVSKSSQIKDKNGTFYQIEEISYENFLSLYTSTFTHFFRSRVNFEPEAFHCRVPRFRCRQLLHGTNIVGIFSGYESDFGKYMMHLSVVHPDFRGIGLYSAYLEDLMNYSKKEGFNRICSEHSTSNNPIIIAKLRKSFFITNIQVTSFYGVEVQLTRFLDEEMENIFKFRCGDLSLSKDSVKRFKDQIHLYGEFFEKIQSEE
jgi:ribosomal protein S18 acetylase RimI-like enzyme